MPDEELLARAAAGDLHQPEVLVAQARRMLRDDRSPRPGDRVRRQLARLPPLRGAQQRRSRAVPDASRTSCGRRCSRSRSASSSMWCSATARCSISCTRKHTFVNPVLAKHYGMPDAERAGRRVGAGRRRATYGRGGLLPMAVFLTQERAGPAHQPGQARLLGRPPAARRAHSAAAAERARAAQPTRRSSAT